MNIESKVISICCWYHLRDFVRLDRLWIWFINYTTCFVFVSVSFSLYFKVIFTLKASRITRYLKLSVPPKPVDSMESGLVLFWFILWKKMKVFEKQAVFYEHIKHLINNSLPTFFHCFPDNSFSTTSLLTKRFGQKNSLKLNDVLITRFSFSKFKLFLWHFKKLSHQDENLRWRVLDIFREIMNFIQQHFSIASFFVHLYICMYSSFNLGCISWLTEAALKWWGKVL